MLDLSTLPRLTDGQLLIRLIARLTSLVTVQHRDRSPSSTVCRNGNTCSYRPNRWFSHALHTVRRPATPASTKSSAFSQRSALTWRTPCPCRALATPSCFSEENAFVSLAARRRRRQSPGRHRPLPIRFDAPLPPPPSSSLPAACQYRRRRRLCDDIDDIPFNEIQRIAATLPQRRNSFDSQPHGDQPFTARDAELVLFQSFHPFSFAEIAMFPFVLLFHSLSLAEVATLLFALSATAPVFAESLSPRAPGGPTTLPDAGTSAQHVYIFVLLRPHPVDLLCPRCNPPLALPTPCIPPPPTMTSCPTLLPPTPSSSTTPPQNLHRRPTHPLRHRS